MRRSPLVFKVATASLHERRERVKDRIRATVDADAERQKFIALYPHKSLTRPSPPLSPGSIRNDVFNSQLDKLISIGRSMKAFSLSAPKAHWSATVVVMRTTVDSEFEAWVNPAVPGYDDRKSVAPMYGMWENCCSLGKVAAWVVRPQSVHCSGLDEYGNPKAELLQGFRARLMMHELDHLQGKSILQQSLGPDFVVAQHSLEQRDLWPDDFPSIEAKMTPEFHFFDYVTNCVVPIPGFDYDSLARDMFNENARIQSR
jgi:peptide deformylase